MYAPLIYFNGADLKQARQREAQLLEENDRLFRQLEANGLGVSAKDFVSSNQLDALRIENAKLKQELETAKKGRLDAENAVVTSTALAGQEKLDATAKLTAENRHLKQVRNKSSLR